MNALKAISWRISIDSHVSSGSFVQDCFTISHSIAKCWPYSHFAGTKPGFFSFYLNLLNSETHLQWTAVLVTISTSIYPQLNLHMANFCHATTLNGTAKLNLVQCECLRFASAETISYSLGGPRRYTEIQDRSDKDSTLTLCHHYHKNWFLFRSKVQHSIRKRGKKKKSLMQSTQRTMCVRTFSTVSVQKARR